jgi:glutamyl-tRNA synthetase
VVTVQFYRDHGFLPWALINFLVLLGWSTSDDKEIYSKEELIEAFSLEGLNKTNSVFNYHKGDPKFFTDPKAISINEQYLRSMPVEDLYPLVKKDFQAAGLWRESYEGENKQWFLDTLNLIRSRFHTIKDFAAIGRAYFDDRYPIDESAVKKNITKYDTIWDLLTRLAEKFSTLPVFSAEETEKAARELADELGVKPGVLMNGARAVLTGQLAGPGIFDVLVAIGREKVVERLRRAREIIEANG